MAGRPFGHRSCWNIHQCRGAPGPWRDTIIELEADAMRDERSLVNHRAVVPVTGVRDRLRVLLVSGQPHLGERTWRNLLKSAPSVDLVHFTILRPPEKSDFTPLNELALIPFPIRELFEIKLIDFDLIVFDRYVLRYVLPMNYFQNIGTYVQDGVSWHRSDRSLPIFEASTTHP